MRQAVLGVLLVVCSVTPLAWGRRSPHADLALEYYRQQTGSTRFSDNILEDSQLDVPGLISKYGYPVEVHKVVTDDRYILELQRIPYGKGENNAPGTKRPVVLVMHGLFSSSADWVSMGPGTALAYELADAGYDVWLGNARGNYYSRKHITLDPDSKQDAREFWAFSWEQFGMEDLPAMIDYALYVSGQSKLHYIGHSQGTTAFFAMGGLRPEYNDKILSMHALAPVAYMQYNQHPLIRAIAPYTNTLELALKLLGVNELLPKSPLISELGAKFCNDEAMTQILCSNMLFLLAGRSVDMHNATMFPVMVGHTPAGASARQLVHYGQLVGEDYFRRFDYGPILNLANYRSLSPPRINLAKITAPTYLHHCDVDLFADHQDVLRLNEELGNSKGLYRVDHETFSHLDFMWGSDALNLVYRPMIKLMKENE